MTIVLHPDWSASTVPFPHTWAHIANIDQFRWLMRTDVREHLRMARDELGVAPGWSLQQAVTRTVQWYRRRADGADARALCLADIEDHEGPAP